jgi:hypothetical protein
MIWKLKMMNKSTMMLRMMMKRTMMMRMMRMRMMRSLLLRNTLKLIISLNSTRISLNSSSRTSLKVETNKAINSDKEDNNRETNLTSTITITRMEIIIVGKTTKTMEIGRTKVEIREVNLISTTTREVNHSTIKEESHSIKTDCALCIYSIFLKVVIVIN